MLPHNLVKVTIFIDGLPEHCGTDEALQELTDDAEGLAESVAYEQLLAQKLTDEFPQLTDKIKITVVGLD